MISSIRRLLPVSLVAALAIALLAVGVLHSTSHPVQAASSSNGQSLCIAYHPQSFVWYNASCTGHDEPEINPLSSHAGSAQDLTWTIVLPGDGTAVSVDAVGPTFWIGGVVNDPNSLLGQAFLEL